MADSEPPKKPDYDRTKQAGDRIKQAVEALRKAQESLGRTSKKLPSKEECEALGSRLKDLNDSYPATRAFLNMRGLTSVRDLDAQGIKDLERYLEQVLSELTKDKSN